MKNDKSLAKTAVICIIAAVIVVAVFLFAVLAKKGYNSHNVVPLTKYTVTKKTADSDESKEGEEDNSALVFTDEAGQAAVIDGSDYMTDLAQDRFIIVKNMELAFFADGKIAPIAKNVISCTISNDGSVVGYIVPNTDEKKYEGTLYAYNTVTGETEVVCETAFVSTSNRIQLSPSGDVIAYAKDYDEESMTYDCCYSINGKETVFGQNRDIQAISDKAKYIYYTIEDPEKYSSILAVYSKKGGEVILDEESYNRFYLNLDYSECVFYKGKDDPALYITRKGSAGELYMENDENFDTSSLVSHVNPVINTEEF